MTVTTSLPSWLPLINLLISSVALVLSIVIVFRVARRRISTWTLLAVAALTSSVVLVAGALSQMALLAVDTWVLFGSGGRAMLVILLITVVAEGSPRDRE